MHGRGHWPSAEQTLDMVDLRFRALIGRVVHTSCMHENGFQMQVVIERDLEDDGLFLGRVERRWPHGMSASGYVVISLANGENRSRISRMCVVPLELEKRSAGIIAKNRLHQLLNT